VRTPSVYALGFVLATLARPAAAAPIEEAVPAFDRLRELLPQSLGRFAEPFEPRVVPQDDAGAPAVSLARVDDPAALERTLRGLVRAPYADLKLRVTDGTAHVGSYSVGSGETVDGNVLVIRGRAEVFGRVTGNLVSLDSDILVHRGAVVEGDALALGGKVQLLGGQVRGEAKGVEANQPAPAPPPSALARTATNLAGVIGSVLTLGLLGFGLVTFGRPNLEIVSDTVVQSFGRSFAVGLLGQILIVPTFGMLVVGLALSVVGILLIPFVVAVYVLLVVGATLGGFLAVTHAMGETRTRRQMARGVALSPNSFRYLGIGLGAVAAVWLVWALFGWVPVAGTLILAAAVIATWLLATVGLGACVLSRAGVKPAFAGRFLPTEMLTDEYLWATPQQGVPAVKRPPRA
jgi:hypothetical protein